MKKNNFFIEFTESVASVVYNFIVNGDLKDFKPLGKVTTNLLYNNGCDITSDKPLTYKEVFIDKSLNYNIVYIIGVTPNQANTSFDYTEYNGSRYLFIFLDYLKDAKLEPGDPNNKYEVGNASIYDKLCNMVRGFQDSFFSPISEQLQYTIKGTQMRLNPYIIAAFILNIIRPIELVDVDGSPLSFIDLQNYVQNIDKFKDAINGIRWDLYEGSMSNN